MTVDIHGKDPREGRIFKKL